MAIGAVMVNSDLDVIMRAIPEKWTRRNVNGGDVSSPTEWHGIHKSQRDCDDCSLAAGQASPLCANLIDAS
jgi:hypothetical protein